MEENKKSFPEWIKSKRKIVIPITIATIVIVAIIITAVAISSNKKNKQEENEKIENSINMADVTYEENQSNIYATIKVQVIVGKLSEEGKYSNYYLTFDENGYPYILKIEEKEFESLKEIYEYSHSESQDKEKPTAVKVTGITTEIPNEIKEKIIEKYNEKLKMQTLSQENFEQIIGKVYLDVKKIDK